VSNNSKSRVLFQKKDSGGILNKKKTNMMALSSIKIVRIDIQLKILLFYLERRFFVDFTELRQVENLTITLTI